METELSRRRRSPSGNRAPLRAWIRDDGQHSRSPARYLKRGGIRPGRGGRVRADAACQPRQLSEIPTPPARFRPLAGQLPPVGPSLRSRQRSGIERCPD